MFESTSCEICKRMAQYSSDLEWMSLCLTDVWFTGISLLTIDHKFWTKWGSILVRLVRFRKLPISKWDAPIIIQYFSPSSFLHLEHELVCVRRVKKGGRGAARSILWYVQRAKRRFSTFNAQIWAKNVSNVWLSGCARSWSLTLQWRVDNWRTHEETIDRCNLELLETMHSFLACRNNTSSYPI